jgi:ribosomal protein S18 acetylase RimI-like enzyme
VEQVTSSSADELAELDALLFPDNCFNETTLAREIELGFCLVEWIHRTIVAYALVRRGEIYDLLRLGVHPEYQGHGIGSDLLHRIQDMGQPVMLTVRDGNTGALRLYLRNGFRVIGRLHNGHGWVLRYDRVS